VNAQNVQQWTYTGSRSQLWELLPKGAGVYRFRSLYSGKFLDLAKASREDNAKIATWEENNMDPQDWRLIPDQDWVKIQSVCSSKVIALTNMDGRDGTKVIQFADNGTEDHLWRLERVAGRAGDWIASDVGEFKDPSEISVSGDSMSITTHAGDIWNNVDSCTFVSQQVTGDFDFVAQVTELSDPTEFAKVGLMIRKALSPSDSNTFVCITPRKKIFHQRRFDVGGTSTQIGPVEVKMPCWLKLTRRGTTITSFYSTDGAQWTEVQSDQVSGYDSTMEVGVAASAYDNRNTHKVKLEHIALSLRH